MVARRDFLRWLAVTPVGVLAVKSVASCGDDGSRGARDSFEASDLGPEVAADTALDSVAPDTAPDIEPDSAPADTAPAADTSADTAPDTAADTAPDTTPRVCPATQGDVQGPFYLAGAPAVVDLAGELPGTPIAIAGQVTDEACAPIAGASVEVWQADADGDYHDDRLRATLTADGEGRYAFISIMPGRYLQASGFRPAHLHFRVSARGFTTLVTQIYFAGDPYLQPNDSCTFCGSDDPARILALSPDAGNGGRQSARLDIALK